jgi:hypothetical protein
MRKIRTFFSYVDPMILAETLKTTITVHLKMR